MRWLLLLAALVGCTHSPRREVVGKCWGFAGDQDLVFEYFGDGGAVYRCVDRVGD